MTHEGHSPPEGEGEEIIIILQTSSHVVDLTQVVDSYEGDN